MPVLGNIDVAGRTLNELEVLLTKRVSAVHRVQLFVGVEIVKYRSFFIDGDVTNPGSYPFEPGMTIVKAIALAGGRLSERTETLYSPIDRIREREILEVLLNAYYTDIAREARIRAERDGLEDIDFPNLLSNDPANPELARLMENERLIFDTRKDFIQGQLAILDRRNSQAKEQIKALQAQLEVARQRRDIAEEDLTSYIQLSERGVASKSELLRVQLSRTEAEAILKSVEIAIVEVEQEISKIAQEALNIETNWNRETAESIQAFQERIEKSEIQIKAAQERLAVMVGIKTDAVAGQQSMPEPVYSVIRMFEGELAETQISALDSVFPGDVIRVHFHKITPPRVPDPVSDSAHIAN